jgi:hypothetical protein
LTTTTAIRSTSGFPNKLTILVYFPPRLIALALIHSEIVRSKSRVSVEVGQLLLGTISCVPSIPLFICGAAMTNNGTIALALNYITTTLGPPVSLASFISTILEYLLKLRIIRYVLPLTLPVLVL